MDNSKYILNEISKGLQMGMDSISNITQKIGDQNLKDDLFFQYNEYYRFEESRCYFRRHQHNFNGLYIQE